MQAQVGPVSLQPAARPPLQGGAPQVTGVLPQEGGRAVRGGGVHGAHRRGL